MIKNCCCCGLREGSLAVAIVFLSLSALEFLGILVGWGAVDAAEATAYRSSHAANIQYISASFQFPIALMASLTVYVIIQLAFDVMLAFGIRLSMSRPSSARCYVLSWLIFRAVIFGIQSLAALALLIVAIYMRYAELEIASVMVGANFVTTTVICLLCWYAWTVVASFYMQMSMLSTTGIAYNGLQMESAPMEVNQETAGAAPPGILRGA